MAAVLAMSIFGALQIASLVVRAHPLRDGARRPVLSRVWRASVPRTHVPVRALVAQGVWAIVLVLSGSFDTLTDYAIFAILIFFGLATASVFVFRRTMPDAERPYRTWGYPVVPVLFLLVRGLLLINTLMTTPGRALAGLGLMALGLPFYWYWSRSQRV